MDVLFEYIIILKMNLIPETDKIDMAYLKSERIGRVITRGLSELYRVKPQFPIEYLAKWLLNYNATEANRGSMQEHLNTKEQLMYCKVLKLVSNLRVNVLLSKNWSSKRNSYRMSSISKN